MIPDFPVEYLHIRLVENYFNRMGNINIIHIGSYWQGENDVVNLMQRALKRLPGGSVLTFDPNLYNREAVRFVQRDGQVNWIHDGVMDGLVNDFSPEVIICNAGGLSPTPQMHQKLSAQGIIRVGIALSDPDDFERRTSRFAHYFDHFFTNARSALEYYSRMGVPASLLPFAADAEYHRPLDVRKTHDVVIVGGKRPERVEMVSRLKASGFSVMCYGRGWRNRWLERLGFSSEVHGERQVQAICSGRIYLSFPLTRAGFSNVKVGIFEAAACGACILCEDFEELHEYFTPGEEIVNYTSAKDAIQRVKQLLSTPEQINKIGEAARLRVLREHTWELRWKKVFEDIGKTIG